MSLSKSVLYRLFTNHMHIEHRFYHLHSVISIDEFKATTDLGTYAFHIFDPINGKTIDIVENRKASTLRNYFLHFPYKERKKVKIIIFKSIMHSLFPNASIIADRFHYVKLCKEHLHRCRIDTCASMTNDKLAKSFDKYIKDLDYQTEWYDYH